MNDTNYKINLDYENLNAREKFLDNGLESITTQELLMLILGSGIKNCPIDELSWKVLNALDYKDSDQLFYHLCEIPGIGKNKAMSICASLELGKRLFTNTKKAIRNANDVIPLVNHYSLENVEYFICISLNGANEVIRIMEISKGSTNAARIHPREVFTQVLKDNGSAVIFVHNHPSGNVLPSEQDLILTQKLLQGGKLLGLNTLDHLIISFNSYFSMANEGLISRFEKENKIL